MNDFLKNLNSDAGWRKTIGDLGKSARPIIPEYVVSSSIEEREMLLETIKIKTGERRGFDTLYRLLTGETPL